MKKLSGFTLTELMIALAVLGILFALVTPILADRQPNKNKMLVKKAYYATSDIINELVNDISLYPDLDGVCPDNNATGYVGFDCYASGVAKLPYQFSKKLNLSSGVPASQSSMDTSTYKKSTSAECCGVSSSCYYLNTNDNVAWTISTSYSLTKGNPDGYILLGVDINGDAAPNCYQGSTATGCSSMTSDFDQFRIKLYADGRLKINESDTWAIEAVQIGSSITEGI